MAYPASQSYAPRPYEMSQTINPIPFPPISSSPAVAPPPSAAAIDHAGYPPQPPYELHYPARHQYHPPPAVMPSVVHANPEQQKIHTLFVSGLPDDIKPREIHNLFRRRPGFDSCQLEYTGRGNQVVAFATFFNHQSAMAAMSTLNGAIFDPQSGATLHIELARSNSRTKRPRGGGAYAVIDKRTKINNNDQESESNDDSGSDESSSTDNDNSSKEEDRGETEADLASSKVEPNEQFENASSGDISPCSTLFIANLGPNCTNEELREALSKFSGFSALKMRGRSGMPVAFADFKDVESSTEAMNNLQGTLLKSSDRGGLHIEYARSKMRKS